MSVKIWVKPLAFGAVCGAIAAIGLGFGMGGWTTASKAEVIANEQSRAEVSAALLPICLDLSDQDIQRASKIDKIRSAPSYQRMDVVSSTGWTTMPGTEGPDRRVARACIDALLEETG